MIPAIAIDYVENIVDENNETVNLDVIIQAENSTESVKTTTAQIPEPADLEVSGTPIVDPSDELDAGETGEIEGEEVPS